MPTRPPPQIRRISAVAAGLLTFCLSSLSPAQPSAQPQPLTVEVHGCVQIAPEPGLTSPLTVTITNTTSEPLETGVACDAPPGWRAHPPTARIVLTPGERFFWPVTLTAPALAENLSGRPEVLVRVRAVPLDARGPARQAAAITRRLAVPVDAMLDPAPQPETDAFLRLNARSALRLDLDRWTDRGPFTLEARVRGSTPDGRSAVASNTEGSGFGLYWSVVPANASLPAAYVHAAGEFVSAEASQPWDWARWTHLALVYDGRSLALFVNGRLIERTPVPAPIDHNTLPLMIGADVDADARPISFWTGDLDDVRLSSVARYDADFTPAASHTADADTLALFNFDEAPGPVVRNLAAPYQDAIGHAWTIGSPEMLAHDAEAK